MGSESVARVTRVSTNLNRRCEHCDYYLKYEDHAAGINHYIVEHGYRLLHVGQETCDSYDGSPWQMTVAILGSDNPPPLRDVVAASFTFDIPDEEI